MILLGYVLVLFVGACAEEVEKSGYQGMANNFLHATARSVAKGVTNDP
jgi:hypothetical protein